MWAKYCTEADPCLIRYTVDGAPFFRWSKHIGPDRNSTMVPVEDYVYESKWHMTDALVDTLALSGWDAAVTASAVASPAIAPVPVPWALALYGTALVVTALLLMVAKGGGRE